MSIDKPAITGLLDNLYSPEVFATAPAGFLMVNGNIAITFETARSDYSTNPPTLNRIVIGRLVLPISGAQSLVKELSDFLIAQGANPSATVTGAPGTKQ